jgi:UDP-N-acetyl-2-amino-2-deoxyglucuronate dehydrogenase
MPARPIGVALLGCGFIARTHIRNLLEFADQLRIVALCDRSGQCGCDTLDFLRSYAAEQAASISERLTGVHDDATRERLAARHSGLTAAANDEISQYTSRDVLAADPRVDLVINSTPPFVHYRSTLELLSAGKHVLLEKPFTGSLRYADEMIAEAERRKLVLSVVSQGRFADEQRRMAALVRAGKLGRTIMMKADTHWWRRDDYYRLWWRGNWANEQGGVLMNHAWHLLDQGLFIMGQPVRRISAQMGAFGHTVLHEKKVGGVPIEDTMLALLTFADGSLGEVTASVTLHIQRAQLEVFGTKAAVQLNPWQLDSQDPAYAAEIREWAATAIEPMPAEWQPPTGGTSSYMDPTWPHTPQIHDVLNAIREGRQPALSGREGRATLEVVLGAYKSAITGQPVDLPLQPDDPFYDGVAKALSPDFTPLPVE